MDALERITLDPTSTGAARRAGVSPEQQAIIRSMTPRQRWEAAVRLYWSARRLKTAFVRSVHPDWPDERVAAYVRDAFLHARS
jgi:hypothetical protein